MKINILQPNSQKEIIEGTCCRISTGAPLPPGANCVVPIESTSVVSKSKDETIELNINIIEEPKMFDNIRYRKKMFVLTINYIRQPVDM